MMLHMYICVHAFVCNPNMSFIYVHTYVYTNVFVNSFLCKIRVAAHTFFSFQ